MRGTPASWTTKAPATVVNRKRAPSAWATATT
jgi:hypothetical protein